MPSLHEITFETKILVQYGEVVYIHLGLKERQTQLLHTAIWIIQKEVIKNVYMLPGIFNGKKDQ